jgi:hypothetical protein
MSDFLIAFASEWAKGSRVPCRFKAWADGNPLTAKDDTAPVYQIPAGTQEVKLTATPQASPSNYWENTVLLQLGASGLTAKPGSEGFVKTTTRQFPFGFQGTAATVVLSQFKEVTKETLALLSSPPATRLGKTVHEIMDHQATWGTWPPAADWAIEDLTGADFIDATTPVKSGALNFVKSDLQINVDSVVLQLANVDAPQRFAVTWPDAIKPSPNATPRPTRFLVFIEQSLQGNHYDQWGLFVGGELAAPDKAYPNNFDYADMLFQQLHYAQDSPFVNPGMKGVPYQVARAGADNVVTVVPSNSFEKEFGVMEDTERTGDILLNLQAFMFMRAGVATPPTSVGKTALASFSSGNFILGRWLQKTANLSGDFLKKTVNAVYFLDPLLDPKAMVDVNTFIPSALNWEKKSGTDKRIRLYMRFHAKAHNDLIGATPSAPYVHNSSPDGRRTAAELPTAVWTAALTKWIGHPLDPKKFTANDAFGFAHHMFAATMLTHALSQKDSHSQKDLS